MHPKKTLKQTFKTPSMMEFLIFLAISFLRETWFHQFQLVSPHRVNKPSSCPTHPCKRFRPHEPQKKNGSLLSIESWLFNDGVLISWLMK